VPAGYPRSPAVGERVQTGRTSPRRGPGALGLTAFALTAVAVFARSGPSAPRPAPQGELGSPAIPDSARTWRSRPMNGRRPPARPPEIPYLEELHTQNPILARFGPTTPKSVSWAVGRVTSPHPAGGHPSRRRRWRPRRLRRPGRAAPGARGPAYLAGRRSG